MTQHQANDLLEQYRAQRKAGAGDLVAPQQKTLAELDAEIDVMEFALNCPPDLQGEPR